MRIMLDTNVLVSAIIFNNKFFNSMIDIIANEHSLVLSSFVIDELHMVVSKKFPKKTKALEIFLTELPFTLEYTPKILPEHELFIIRDRNDEKVLYSAITADVDLLITGDKDFETVDIFRPDIMTPREFLNLYGLK